MQKADSQDETSWSSVIGCYMSIDKVDGVAWQSRQSDYRLASSCFLVRSKRGTSRGTHFAPGNLASLTGSDTVSAVSGALGPHWQRDQGAGGPQSVGTAAELARTPLKVYHHRLRDALL